MKDNKEYAFPLISPDGIGVNLGMSMRDYIAVHALQGMLAYGGINGHIDGRGDAELHAVWAYEYADALLKNSSDIPKEK